MRRWWSISFGIFLLLGWLLPGVATAQEFRWPEIDLTGAFPYGPGYDLSLTKIGLSWLVFCMWVYTSGFVNVQGQQRGYRFIRWNALVFFTFVPSFILLWYIPIFWLGFPLMVITWVVPLTLFVRHFNKDVPYHEQVMTKPHLRFWFSELVGRLGIKMEAERRSADELIAVKLIPMGGEDSTQDGVNLLQAKESPAFNLTREMIVDALARRSDAIMLDFTQQAVGIRYQIDGLWTNGEPQDRETGDAMLAVLKIISSLNPANRRSRQQGEFGATYRNTKYKCKITTQGTKTGERALLHFDAGAAHFENLSDLGMRDKMIEQVRELLARHEGFLLFSAPPACGLSATITGALGSADRFMRDFKAIEDVHHPEATVENIDAVTYDSAEGEGPDSALPQLLLKHPDVIICRDLVNLETVNILCDQAQGRLVVSGLRAKDSVEALLRVLAFKVEPEKFSGVVSGVLNQRLARKPTRETCPQLVEFRGPGLIRPSQYDRIGAR